MSSIYAQPTELLRLEVDPHADMHDPSRPYRIVLFNPETDVTEGRSEDESDAVLNLSFDELMQLRQLCNDLLAQAAEGVVS